MRQIFTGAIDDQVVRQQNVEFRVRRKLRLYRRKCAGKVLFIAVQPRQHVTGSTGKTTVERVIDSAVAIHAKSRACRTADPFLQLGARPAILDEVLHFHALILDRAHAKSQPIELPEAGCDDGKAHERTIPHPWPDEHPKIADWTKARNS